MNKRVKSNSIRIIAGVWRGRRLPVLDHQGLRPTTDRVRETVFNWLMHDVAGAQCLDLFAGSGALGFECLSRGAKAVDFVETERSVTTTIGQNLELLLGDKSAEKAEIYNIDALRFLQKKAHKHYDIVFLDPPFQSSMLLKSLQLLLDFDWLSDNALVYLEHDSSDESMNMPEEFELYRQGKAGQSAYFIYSFSKAKL